LAADGDSAIAMAAQRPPDVVITDVLMPGLDGYELARALRGEPATRHIPIVFSTAHYGMREIRPLANACDVHDVILKPADPAMVLATVDALLGVGRIRAHAAEQVAETQRLTRSGTWELDPATGTVVVSPTLCEVFRLASPRLAIDELLRRLHPDDLATIATVVENTWFGGTPSSAELRVIGADGAVRELLVSFQVAVGPETPRLWGVAQDVTPIREELRAKLRMEADWHAVRGTIDALHRAVLAPELPAVAGADLAAVYLSAPERLDIGAAWYDLRVVDGGRLLLSVGRVAGHDRHPAAAMAHALAGLRVYAHDDPDPCLVLARLNRFLTDTWRDGTYVTAAVALFEPDSGRLRVANGGSPPPVLVSRDGAGNAAAVLLPAAGPALGVVSELVFPQVELTLAADSAICAYTDGLIDRHHDPASADARSLRRVAARVFGRHGEDAPDHPLPPAQRLAEDIVREMLGGAAPDDDVCLAVLRATLDHD
jgi:serine phosphatase RsbU (regulator of sigma subunit)/DNA-binding response OmpR family regulator